ncbi:MAG: adenylate kinase [Candidatus Micrarchaeota archaeon]
MIIVMGLPGAGKSTVLKTASEQGWEVINYGTKMLEIAKGLYSISDRDQIRKLKPIEQKRVQAKVAEELCAIKERKVILDTHCSINTPSGYLPGLPFSIISKLPVEKLVLVVSPIEDILQRREKDTTRVRDEQSEESLCEHDQMNRSYLAAYSVLCAAPAIILQNKNGEIENTRSRFAKLLE